MWQNILHIECRHSWHNELRENVRKRTLDAAEKMKSRYDTSKRIKVCEFTVGDPVTVKVPCS